MVNLLLLVQICYHKRAKYFGNQRQGAFCFLLVHWFGSNSILLDCVTYHLNRIFTCFSLLCRQDRCNFGERGSEVWLCLLLQKMLGLAK